MPVALEHRGELNDKLTHLQSGVSEFTFANLYLFRKRYDYRVAYLPGDRLIISGRHDGRSFFMAPFGLPADEELLTHLLNNFDYGKCLDEETADGLRVRAEQLDMRILEDRDNFDYLYLRKDLATLAGRRYHKKRNLVNAFERNYSYSEAPLGIDNLRYAFAVLEQWQRERDTPGDYDAAREALEKIETLELCGYLVNVNDAPAAFTLGESLARGRIFVVHFEKAIGDYKGIYQFLNRALAAILPRHFTYINREQDLGDVGLRQAKMTYRPSGFIKKYKLVRLRDINGNNVDFTVHDSQIVGV